MAGRKQTLRAFVWGVAVAPWLLLTASCSGDGPTGSEGPPSEPPPPPDVQFATLSVDVTIGANGAGVAGDLGWAGGAVPFAEAIARRSGSEREDTTTTDAAGVARFEDLLEGTYTVSATRRLSEEERALLQGSNRDVSLVAGAGTVVVQPPTASYSLQGTPARQGSLVISEWATNWINTPGVGSYSWGGFLEIYNNADTVVYLDGVLVGSGWARSVRDGQWPCDDFDFMRLDPEGIWTSFLRRFPGDGSDYPLEPGHVVVLATDAIDHSALAEGGLDLTGADFEFIGREDVDNPAVPDLVNVGLGSDFGHHGRFGTTYSGVGFLARGSVDLDALPRATPIDLEYQRVPAEDIIDVGHFVLRGGTIPICEQLVHPSIDEAAASMTGDHTVSLQRVPLVRSEAGHMILQRTRTSARDFVTAPVTPGGVR